MRQLDSGEVVDKVRCLWLGRNTRARGTDCAERSEGKPARAKMSMVYTVRTL